MCNATVSKSSHNVLVTGELRFIFLGPLTTTLNKILVTLTTRIAKFKSKSGTAEGEGLVRPRPYHFFARPPPLFALKRKIIKIKKRLETSFFPSILRYILCIFVNFKRQAFCGAPVLFAVIVPWGRLAP